MTQLDSQVLLEAKRQLKTLEDYIRWGTSQFMKADLHYGHGTDNAWDEALALCCHAIHMPLELLKPAASSARLTDTERDLILALFKQRIEQRIPAAYLTHKATFSGLDFYVDERVLVPRSPLAELIEANFNPWIYANSVKRILDIGTGSACIAIACAYAFSEAKVDAVDISEEALAVAKINVDKLQVSDQVNLIHSDLFTEISPKKQYDIIVSNPPYVSSEEMAAVPAEFSHEPSMGLVAEEEGLAIVLTILKQASDYLTDEGILVVEVGNSAEALQNRLPQLPFMWLEFERGGHGVFLLTAEQLKAYQNT